MNTHSALVYAAVLMLGGCALDGGPDADLAEPGVAYARAKTPPPPPAPSTSLTGTVMARAVDGTSTAVGGASVSIWVETSTGGYHFGHPTTDASGRFSATGIPNGAFVLIYASKAGYKQPCAHTGWYSTTTGLTMNVEVFTEAALLDGVQPAPGSTPIVSGLVYETVNGVRQPIANADVEMEWIDSLVTGWTRSDRDGRYFLCSVPETVGIYAGAQGYPWTWQEVSVTADHTTLDLELTR